MYGPCPMGHWSDTAKRDGGGARLALVVGSRYRVIREFADYDNERHPVGETWTYLGTGGSAYHDGISWFVTLDGVSEWHIPMEYRDGGQIEVLEALDEYIAPF